MDVIMNVYDKFIDKKIKIIVSRAFNSLVDDFRTTYYSYELQVTQEDTISVLFPICKNVIHVANDICIYRMKLKHKKIFVEDFYLIILRNHFNAVVYVKIPFCDFNRRVFDFEYNMSYIAYDGADELTRYNTSNFGNKVSTVRCGVDRQYMMFNKHPSGCYMDEYVITKGCVGIHLNYKDMLCVARSIEQANIYSASGIDVANEMMSILTSIRARRARIFPFTTTSHILKIFTENELAELFKNFIYNSKSNSYAYRKSIVCDGNESIYNCIEFHDGYLKGDDIFIFREYVRQNFFGNEFQSYDENEFFRRFDYENGVVFCRGHQTKYFIKTFIGYIRFVNCTEHMNCDWLRNAFNSLMKAHDKKIAVMEKLCGRMI